MTWDRKAPSNVSASEVTDINLAQPTTTSENRRADRNIRKETRDTTKGPTVTLFLARWILEPTGEKS